MKALAFSYSAMKTFENCPKRFYHERVKKEVRDPGGEASIYGERVHKDLELRLKDNTPLPAETSSYEGLCSAFQKLPGTLIAEQELTLNKDLLPTGWWDADAWLRSKLDVLVLYKEKAVIADWKTGKRRPDFFQLELSALQLFKHYPEIKSVQTTFIWLQTHKMDRASYTIADAPALWQKLLTKTERIEAALERDVWPAKPSGLCPYCPAKNICEFARH